ncbi:MAG: hypothetical protein RBR50_01015 [Candidatus Izemoplasmatales bacterium]|nr:hypothetical protein [Candidatus Izemoplasmatales bacterium]
MKKSDIVEELFNARINGNSIKGNATYEAMLKRVSKQDILNVIDCFYGSEYDCIKYGTKLELIEQLANAIKQNS